MSASGKPHIKAFGYFAKISIVDCQMMVLLESVVIPYQISRIEFIKLYMKFKPNIVINTEPTNTPANISVRVERFIFILLSKIYKAINNPPINVNIAVLEYVNITPALNVPSKNIHSGIRRLVQ